MDLPFDQGDEPATGDSKDDRTLRPLQESRVENRGPAREQARRCTTLRTAVLSPIEHSCHFSTAARNPEDGGEPCLDSDT